MAVLSDASVLIESEPGGLELERHLAQRQQEEFFLAAVAASERLHGVYRAVQPEVRSKRAAFVEAILERFPLLPEIWQRPGPMHRSGLSRQPRA